MSLCIHLVGPRVGEGVVVAGDGAVGCGAPPLGLEVGILVGVFRQRQRVGALVGILYQRGDRERERMCVCMCI
jgi:hypothetical protein